MTIAESMFAIFISEIRIPVVMNRYPPTQADIIVRIEFQG